MIPNLFYEVTKIFKTHFNYSYSHTKYICSMHVYYKYTVFFLVSCCVALDYTFFFFIPVKQEYIYN